MTERLIRYQIILKVKGKHEATVNEGVKQLASDNPNFPKLFRFIMSDNRSESMFIKPINQKSLVNKR